MFLGQKKKGRKNNRAFYFVKLEVVAGLWEINKLDLDVKNDFFDKAQQPLLRDP